LAAAAVEHLRLVRQARLVQLLEITAVLVHLIHLQVQQLHTLAVAVADLVRTAHLITTAEQVEQAVAVAVEKVTTVQLLPTLLTELPEQLISAAAVVVVDITGQLE
jgi:hypothetical protein